MDPSSALPTKTIEPIVPQEGTFSFMLMALAFAFLIYIIQKGELGTYLQFFTFLPTQTATTTGTSPITAGTTVISQSTAGTATTTGTSPITAGTTVISQ